MTTTPALLVAAAGVGFGHAVLPDHWVPLALLGRTRRYPLRRVLRLSGLAGVTHVLVSVLLGAIVIAVGLQFQRSMRHAEDAIVGGLLIATGVGFIVAHLLGGGHSHPHAHSHPHDHEHPHHHPHDHGPRSLAALVVSFGAAASPDLTILPVFLAATAAGTGAAVASVVLFAAVTIATIVALTVAATLGGYRLPGQWLDRWGNAVTALVLIALGALVLAGVI